MRHKWPSLGVWGQAWFWSWGEGAYGKGHAIRMWGLWLGKQDGHPGGLCDQQEASLWGYLCPTLSYLLEARSPGSKQGPEKSVYEDIGLGSSWTAHGGLWIPGGGRSDVPTPSPSPSLPDKKFKSFHLLPVLYSVPIIVSLMSSPYSLKMFFTMKCFRPMKV